MAMPMRAKPGVAALVIGINGALARYRFQRRERLRCRCRLIAKADERIGQWREDQ